MRTITHLALSGILLTVLTLPHSQAQAGPIRDWLAKRHQASESAPVEAAPPGVSTDAPTATEADDLPPGARKIADLPYGPDKRQRMDVYLPAHPQQAPVILMVHGGAWAIGDKSHGKVVQAKIAHWLPMGIVFVSVNYPMLPEASPTEQATQVAHALVEAQKQADKWGADRQRFVLMGHSAGAHIVALLSAAPEMATALGASPWQGGVLLDSAALDVPRIMQTPRHLGLYDKAFGQDTGYWAKASPWHQLTKLAPPMLAVCSSKRQDSCDQANAFADKAGSLGVKVTVLSQNLSHGDINGELGKPRAYTEAVDAFLATLPGFKRAISP